MYGLTKAQFISGLVRRIPVIGLVACLGVGLLFGEALIDPPPAPDPELELIISLEMDTLTILKPGLLDQINKELGSNRIFAKTVVEDYISSQVIRGLLRLEPEIVPSDPTYPSQATTSIVLMTSLRGSPSAEARALLIQTSIESVIQKNFRLKSSVVSITTQIFETPQDVQISPLLSRGFASLFLGFFWLASLAGLEIFRPLIPRKLGDKAVRTREQ
jgi:hypothetical protein